MRLLTRTLAVCCLGVLGCSASGPNGQDASLAERRSCTFDVRHELRVAVPPGAGKLRIWFAMPQEVPEQTVTAFKVDCAFPTRFVKDSEGNSQVYCETSDPKDKEVTLIETFAITRREVRGGLDAGKTRPYTPEDLAGKEKYLAPNQNVVIDDGIRKLAREVTGGERNPVLAARKIYDWELENIDYWVKDPKNKKASSVGSTEYCLRTKTGNCTDFHSLWASLARASGIPTRIVYGSFFKRELDGQDVDQSYHCWPEFYVPGRGWVPHDVAVADIFHDKFEVNKDNEVLVRRTTADGYSGPDAAKVDYYFGNIDERRVTWSIGRDLILSPRQDTGPVNALPKAYVEVDGKPYPEGKGTWLRKLTYRERKDG